MNSDWQEAIRLFIKDENALEFHRRLFRLTASICRGYDYHRFGFSHWGNSEYHEILQGVWLKLARLQIRDKMIVDLHTTDWNSFFAATLKNYLNDLWNKAENRYRKQIVEEDEPGMK